MRKILIVILVCLMVLLSYKIVRADYVGDFSTTSTSIVIPWNTFDGNGASVAPTTAGSVYVIRDDGNYVTKGVTDGRNISTGKHRVTIDATAGDVNCITGHDYVVDVCGVLVASQTINANIGQFSIENRPATTYAKTADANVTATLAASGTAAAYAIVNSGLAFRGTATAVPGTNQFTVGSLVGLGTGIFVDTTSPWYAYVLRDANGGGTGIGGAPQGEERKITAYDSATGIFTTEAFSAPVGVGDDIIICSSRLGEVKTIENVDATQQIHNNSEGDRH